MIQDLATAYSSIPKEHLGILVALGVVVGGMCLLGVMNWRRTSSQMQADVVRAEMIQQMLSAGLSSAEILSILDHPAIAAMTPRQCRHSNTVRLALQRQVKPPRVLETAPARKFQAV